MICTMTDINSARRLNIALVCILGLGLFFGFKLKEANLLDKRLSEINKEYIHLHRQPDETLKLLHIKTIYLKQGAVEAKDSKHVINFMKKSWIY